MAGSNFSQQDHPTQYNPSISPASALLGSRLPPPAIATHASQTIRDKNRSKRAFRREETNAASGRDGGLTGRRRRRRPWWRTWRASWRTSATAAPRRRTARHAARAPPGSASGSRARRPPPGPARAALSTGPPWAAPQRSPRRFHQSPGSPGFWKVLEPAAGGRCWGRGGGARGRLVRYERFRWFFACSDLEFGWRTL